MTTQVTTQELVGALEAVLDCWLDGRCEELDERERAVLDRANAAIEAIEAATACRTTRA